MLIAAGQALHIRGGVSLRRPSRWSPNFNGLKCLALWKIADDESTLNDHSGVAKREARVNVGQTVKLQMKKRNLIHLEIGVPELTIGLCQSHPLMGNEGSAGKPSVSNQFSMVAC